jgi:polyhydroxyalkanoate synthesis regulator phasin
VIHDDSGKIMGVHYEELAPLLRSALQRQHEEISELRRQVADLNELRAMLSQLRAKDAFAAQR